jgi:hypothetical protein
VSPPVGPAGILECSGDDPEPEARAGGPSRFRVAGGYSVFATDLSFASGADAYIERRAATASLSYRLSDAISLQVGAGATLGGRFVFRQDRFTFDPGWIASVAGTYRVYGKTRSDPFVIIGGAVAASGAATRDAAGATEDMFAFDLRISAIAGKTFFDILSPYVALRAFGGPILWKYRGEDQVGGDKYHFQVGAGLLVALPGKFDAFAEVVPLGERAATLGLGYSF